MSTEVIEPSLPTGAVDDTPRHEWLARQADRVERMGWLIGNAAFTDTVCVVFSRLTGKNIERPLTIEHEDLAHPFSLTTAYGDLCTFYEVIDRGEYDLEGLERAVNGHPIVDIGANIGFTTALLATRCPDSRVLSIEACERNARLLAGNTRAYGPKSMWRIKLSANCQAMPCWKIQTLKNAEATRDFYLGGTRCNVNKAK